VIVGVGTKRKGKAVKKKKKKKRRKKIGKGNPPGFPEEASIREKGINQITNRYPRGSFIWGEGNSWKGWLQPSKNRKKPVPKKGFTVQRILSLMVEQEKRRRREKKKALGGGNGQKGKGARGYCKTNLHKLKCPQELGKFGYSGQEKVFGVPHRKSGTPNEP